MDRYRSFAPLDDVALTEGDSFLVGVNDFDMAENLRPGIAQSAVNKDFTQANGATRGGITCHPQLGMAPFGGVGYWQTRTTPTTGYEDVVFANGLFVAVGVNVAMSSADGITWTSRTPATALDWEGIAYGNGIFVAVAVTGTGNRVMTSPDGITWTSRTSAADNTWRSVTYGAGLFVAVADSGSGNRVMTSPNGITWTSRVSAADSNWSAVIYAGNQFVAIATALAGTANTVMTSPDGITWTGHASAANSIWRGLAYGNGLYVAVGISNGTGTTNGAMTSPDGITWTGHSSAADNEWYGLTYGSGRFIAVSITGSGNRVMTSTDGATWTIGASAADNFWEAIAFGNNVFVAVSETGGTSSAMSASAQTVFAAGVYSDPNDPASTWTVMAGATSACFARFGDAVRTIAYPASYVISSQSTIVQANNYLIIMAGPNLTPIRWDGNWSGAFAAFPVSTEGAGFVSIPHSNHATYYVNRLWVKSGKDNVAASDLLDFTNYDDIFNSFNTNIGTSDFVVCTYPFGIESLIVFKNHSIQLLQSVAAGLDDVIATEVTRQVGIVGINAVVGVGPDIAYVSDRNVNLITLTATSNAVQHKTEPLSRDIKTIMQRVNWNVANKISVGYWNNKLYVALPLDNSTYCNAIAVYNFVTGQWWGEWNFHADQAIAIQGFVLSVYNGATRLHMVTENGRVFITDDGPQDISGSTTSEISDSLTTRAYRMNNDNRVNRRLWADLGTNRPDFSITAYVDGAGEGSEVLSNQTYYRGTSWLFNDSGYALNNSGDDYNREGREDYAGLCSESIQPQSGFLPEMLQQYRLPVLTRRKGRTTWIKISNTQGKVVINGAGFEARAGDRSSLTQVI